MGTNNGNNDLKELLALVNEKKQQKETQTNNNVASLLAAATNQQATPTTQNNSGASEFLKKVQEQRELFENDRVAFEAQKANTPYIKSNYDVENKTASANIVKQPTTDYLKDSFKLGFNNSIYNVINGGMALNKVYDPTINTDDLNAMSNYVSNKEQISNNISKASEKMYNLQDEENEDYTRQYAHKKGTDKLVGDMAQSLGAAVPQVLSALTGGAGANAVMAFFSGLGSTYKEAKQSGADDNKALLAGTLSGGTSAGLNYLLGGIGDKFGGGNLSKESILKAIKTNIKGDLKQSIAIMGVDMAGEGIEEYLEAITDGYIEKLYNDNGDNFIDTFKSNQGEALYSALLGALTAGALDGMEIAANNVGNVANSVVNTTAQATNKVGSGAKALLNKVEALKKGNQNTNITENTQKMDLNTQKEPILSDLQPTNEGNTPLNELESFKLNGNSPNLANLSNLEHNNVVSGNNVNVAQNAQKVPTFKWSAADNVTPQNTIDLTHHNTVEAPKYNLGSNEQVSFDSKLAKNDSNQLSEAALNEVNYDVPANTYNDTLAEAENNLINDLAKSFNIKDTIALREQVAPIVEEFKVNGKLSNGSKENLYKYVSKNTTGDSLLNDMHKGKSDVRHYEFDKALNNYIDSKLAEGGNDMYLHGYGLTDEEIEAYNKEFEEYEAIQESKNVYDYFKGENERDMSTFGALMDSINKGEEPVIENSIDEGIATEALSGNINYNDTMDRIFDKVAKTKEARQELRDKIETPLYNAKSQRAFNTVEMLNKLKTNIVEKYGIKPNSTENVALYKYMAKKDKTKVDPYTLEDLQAECPNTWENVVEASKLLKEYYDEYYGKLLQKDKQVYPNAEADIEKELNNLSKRLTKLRNEVDKDREQLYFYESLNKNSDISKQTRANIKAKDGEIYLLSKQFNKLKKDYESGEALRNKRLLYKENYVHKFKRQSTGWKQLKDILNGNAEIDPTLVGVSDFTKPKTAWSSIYQKQGLSTDYDEDALGAFVDYAVEAEYKLAMDPFVASLRGITKNLAQATKESKNANNLILYLTDIGNDIARKTNEFDRSAKTRVFDRKTWNVLKFINSRVKANAVVGNARTAVAQYFNLGNSLGLIKNPVDVASGVKDFINIKSDSSQAKLNESAFLTERYMSEKLSDFEPSKGAIRDFTDNLTNFMLELGDKQVAEFTYLAAYNQAIRKGIADPARYADDLTKSSVGGRGVGDIPLALKSEVSQLIAPFQLEVANTYYLWKDKLKNREFLSFIEAMAANYVMNRFAFFLTGNTPAVDYIDAIIDGVGFNDDEEKNIGDIVLGVSGRVAGETLSNMPYGSIISEILLNSLNDTQKEAIFGEEDPSRYGVNNMAIDTFVKPIGQLVTGNDVDYKTPILTTLMPYGAKQVVRTTDYLEDSGLMPEVTFNTNEGFKSTQKNGVYTKDDKLKFILDDRNPYKVAQGMLFGTSATQEAKNYYDSNRTSLSAEQTKVFEEITKNAPYSTKEELLEAMYAAKKAKSIKNSDGDTIRLSKSAVIRQMLEEYDLTTSQKKKVYESLGVSKDIANMSSLEFEANKSKYGLVD